jgi:hypothetical protein
MSKPLIYIDAYWRSLNKVHEELCGDRVQIKRSDDCVVMVLADGLGSGVKANILSTLTSTIISEMIFSGMKLSDAVDTITATLPVCKERGIAYSTFTIIQIYYDGRTYMAEFDNPAVVVMHEGRVMHLDKEAQQLNGRTVYTSSLTASVGDRFIAFSDGVLHAGVGMTLNFGWGQKEVESFLEKTLRPQDGAREITQVLLANVNYLYNGQPYDDSTAACLNLVQGTDTRVMVGPPSKKEDDAKVVDLLMAASGRKICCGGTTSEIVARQLGRELTTDSLDVLNLHADVPPKGYIEGVDLVTEGVLTLQKAGRIIAKAAENPRYYEDVLASKEQDGAALLSRYLLQASWVTFLVGLSDNPAHDAIDYSPISLNAKIHLIEEISENLRKTGRIVHIQMF